MTKRPAGFVRFKDNPTETISGRECNPDVYTGKHSGYNPIEMANKLFYLVGFEEYLLK